MVLSCVQVESYFCPGNQWCCPVYRSCLSPIQANSSCFKGNFGKTSEKLGERIWAFPSAYIPSWAERNCSEMKWWFCLDCLPTGMVSVPFPSSSPPSSYPLLLPPSSYPPPPPPLPQTTSPPSKVDGWCVVLTCLSKGGVWVIPRRSMTWRWLSGPRYCQWLSCPFASPPLSIAGFRWVWLTQRL